MFRLGGVYPLQILLKLSWAQKNENKNKKKCVAWNSMSQ